MKLSNRINLANCFYIPLSAESGCIPGLVLIMNVRKKRRRRKEGQKGGLSPHKNDDPVEYI